MGALEEARTCWHRASQIDAQLPASMARAARAAYWADDASAVREDLAALDGSGFHGPAVGADRTSIRAGLAALEGRSADALALYREALRSWQDLGLAWDEALCGLDMTLHLDPTEPEVRAAALASREILVRLEAAPFIARLDAALDRPSDTPGQPAGLTGTASVTSLTG